MIYKLTGLSREDVIDGNEDRNTVVMSLFFPISFSVNQSMAKAIMQAWQLSGF
jgi:hypothetical protein